MKKKIFIFQLILFLALKTFSQSTDIKIGFNGMIVHENWNPIIINFNNRINEVHVEIEKIPVDKNDLTEKETFKLNNIDKIESSFFYNDNISDIVISIFSDNVKMQEYKYFLSDKTTAASIILSYNLTNEYSEKLAGYILPGEKKAIINLKDKDLYNFAVNYSAVKTIFLNFDNLKTTISQEKALKTYVSQGKNIYAVNTEKSTSILGLRIDDDKIINYASGKIFLTSAVSESYTYDDSKKESFVNKLFDKIENKYINRETKVTAYLILIIFSLFWLISNAIVLIFIKKKSFIFIALLNIIYIFLSFYSVNKISGLWYRGVNITSTALLFSGSENIFYNIKIEKEKTGTFNLPAEQKSAFLGIELDIAHILNCKILPKKKMIRTIQPYNYIKASVKNDRHDNFEITGYEKLNEEWNELFEKLINNEPLMSLIDENKIEIASNFYMFYDNKFYIRSFSNDKNKQWIEIKNLFPEISNYKKALDYIGETFKNNRLYFCFVKFEQPQIRINKNAFNKTFVIIIK